MEKTPDPPVEEAEHQEESAPLLPDLLTPDEDPEKQAPTVKPTATRRYNHGFYLIAIFTQLAVVFQVGCEHTKCTTCTELTLIVLMGLNFIAMGILHYIGP